jgi:hypothetical protein
MIVPAFHQAMVSMKAQKSQFKRWRAWSRITKASPRGMAMPSSLITMELANSNDMGSTLQKRAMQLASLRKKNLSEASLNPERLPPSPTLFYTEKAI